MTVSASAFVPIPDSDAAQTSLSTLEREHIAGVREPLDGMWQAFAGFAVPYGVFDGELLVARCRVDSEQRVLAFYSRSSTDGRALFAAAVEQLALVGAVASTGDVAFTSHCLDLQKSVNVNAVQYELATSDMRAAAGSPAFPEGTSFAPVAVEHLAVAVALSAEALGADPGWLAGYYGGLVDRGELHGLWQGGSLIALGEHRPSTTQTAYSDVGMVVGTEHRRQGLATSILRALVQIAQAAGRNAVCSTEVGNVAAQKAIAAAGFVPRHRIVEYVF